MNSFGAVEAYLARGFAVIPVPRGQKRPVLPGWQKLRLTKDELPKHFECGANIGVLNGEPSGGLVDVDLDATETVALADVFLPDTALVFGRPGKPRAHRLYRTAPLIRTIRFEDPDGSMLVELRGTGTQTIWPPSLHPTGDEISFASDGVPASVHDRELLDAVILLATSALLARYWPPTNGTRHAVALPAAGFLLRQGLGEPVVKDIIRHAAALAGDEEARARVADVVTTARRRAAGGNVTGGPTLAGVLGEKVVASLGEWLRRHSAHSAHSAGGDAEPWEPPIRLDSIAVPPFPLDALPPVIRNWVTEVADVHKVAPDLPALLGLAAVGAAGARRVEVQIGSTHSEPLNLYVAAVAPSGERKGPALRAMLAPLQTVEDERRQAAEPEIKVAREHRHLDEVRLKHLRELAAKAKTPEARDAAREAALTLGQHLSPVPPMPKLLVSNTTPEKLEGLLAEQDGAMCMVSEEAGAVFEIAAGRYAKDGGSQLDTLLLGYDGGGIDTQRVTREGVAVKRPALSILLTPQPVILRSFQRHPEFLHRGLIARFAFTLPASLVGTRFYENRGVSHAVRDAYEAALRRILELKKFSDPTQIPALRIEAAALDAWRAHHDRLERDQADGARLAGIREWASKHAARVARIAGALHLLTCSHPEPWEVPIAADTLEAAWSMGWYLVEHALAAHDLMGADERLEGARHVLAWIVSSQRKTLTKREVFNGTRSRFKTVDALQPVLDLLVAYGYLRPRAEGQHRGAGRRPSPIYEVNPYAQNTQNTQNEAGAETPR